MSFLHDPNSRTNWGFFGYRGAMCDLAIKADNAEMLKECVERGFVDADCQMLMGGTVLDHCEKLAPKCAEMLKAMRQS